MKRIALFLFVMALLAACDNETSSCAMHATVRDLRSLDGCGFVFELDDHTILVPTSPLWCGTGSPDGKDPLAGFEYVDGMQVLLSYEIIEGVANTCMAGTLVEIKCLEEARQQWNNE